MYVSQTVETLFSIFDSSAVVLRKELDVTYLEALVETGDNLFEERFYKRNYPNQQLKG